MIRRIQQRVESYLRDGNRTDVDPRRYFCLDDSKGPVRGCFLLFFGPRSDAPLLVAKGAPRSRARKREGRIVYEIELSNLEQLQQIGMNRDGPSTPEPLGLFEEDDFVVTLQSALQGRLVKNIPGKQLFSAARVSRTTVTVLAWWRRFQERYGVETRRMTESVYEQEVLQPLQRFRRRFVVGPDERRMLKSRFEEQRSLLGAELPFMATHGDFCTANVMECNGRLSVFDWEFPLRHALPLFDIFHFFASTRFPFRGRHGESSHFESFQAVYWGRNPFNQAVRAGLRQICEEHGIDGAWLADLFVLSLIEIANLKFDGLVEVWGINEERTADPSSVWRSPLATDKDVPFASIRDGVSENVRFVARNGIPSWLSECGSRGTR